MTTGCSFVDGSLLWGDRLSETVVRGPESTRLSPVASTSVGAGETGDACRDAGQGVVYNTRQLERSVNGHAYV